MKDRDFDDLITAARKMDQWLFQTCRASRFRRLVSHGCPAQDLHDALERLEKKWNVGVQEHTNKLREQRYQRFSEEVLKKIAEDLEIPYEELFPLPRPYFIDPTKERALSEIADNVSGDGIKPSFNTTDVIIETIRKDLDELVGIPTNYIMVDRSDVREDQKDDE